MSSASNGTPVFPDKETQLSVFIEDIRFTKTQQWQLAYYSVLIQGAIIFIFNQLKESVGSSRDFPCVISTILILASVWTCYVSVRILKGYKRDIESYRAEKDDLWETDPKAPPQKKERQDRAREQSRIQEEHLYEGFASVFFLATALTVFLIFFKSVF